MSVDRYRAVLFVGLAAALLLVGEGEAEKEPLWSFDIGDDVWSVAISADGEYIAAGTYDDKVYLFDKDSSTPLWNYTTAKRNVRSIAISADGDYITAGSSDKVYLFNMESSTPIWSYTTEGGVLSVAISADGEYITVGSSDDKVYLFDKDNSTPLWSFDTRDEVWSVAISADGKYIAAGSDKIYLFDKDSSTPLWSNSNGSGTVAISADGEYLTAGTVWSGYVYLFDKDNSTPLWSYNTDGTLHSVAISADGEYIAAGSDKIYLFDKDSSTPIWGYNAESYGYMVAISADGEYVAAGSNDNKIYFFERDSQPTAYIDTLSPSTAIRNDVVWFQGHGYDDNYKIVEYQWNSSLDGILSTQSSFNTSSLSLGTHTITFKVRESSGNWSEDESRTIDIINSQSNAVVDLISHSMAEKETTVTFQGHGEDSDGNITAYNWTSSIDGELSTEANFSISSLSWGYHTISFKVKDNDELWSAAVSELLFVYTFPLAIAGDNITVESGQIVQFIGTGTDEDGLIVKYEWDFDGDGVYDWSLSENGRTTNIYNNEGYYTAVLRVTDDDNFMSTDSRVITVTKTGDDDGGDDEGIPAPSLTTPLTAVAAVAVVLRRKRRR